VLLTLYVATLSTEISSNPIRVKSNQISCLFDYFKSQDWLKPVQPVILQASYIDSRTIICVPLHTIRQHNSVYLPEITTKTTMSCITLSFEQKY
jgi:hypothetical protein